MPQNPAGGKTRDQAPLACDRVALSPTERARHFDELGPQLRARRAGVRELPNGYAFDFPADAETVRLLEEWVDGERRCCPFFEIDLAREGDRTRLALTGGAGVKEFIRTDAPEWMRP